VRYYLFFALTFFLTPCTSNLQARIIYVPQEFLTIQAGIDKSVNGDTVLVSDGIYTGEGNRGINFHGKAIVVMSKDGPEDCIIDCERGERGFYFDNGEDSRSVLQGFTIQNGYVENSYGGAIYCGSDPTIINNIIRLNEAGKGGGIYCENASPLILNNVITDNIAEGGFDGYGGGICCRSPVSPTISNNIVARNYAYLWGGGISCLDDASPTIVNNVVYDNEANMEGSGISSKFGSSPDISNSIIWVNWWNSEIYVDGWSSVRVTYCDVWGGWYSGLGNIDANPQFVNPSSDDFHLQSGSACIDKGGPSVLDACRPPGMGGGRSDMGAYGGEGNCWAWEFDGYIDLLIPSMGTVNVRRGDTLTFSSLIFNNTLSDLDGDYWLSMLTPDSSDVLISEDLLNHANPAAVQLSPHNFLDLSSQMIISDEADTGSYMLIGRVGLYPDRVMDEESFGFRVYTSRIIHVPGDYASSSGGE